MGTVGIEHDYAININGWVNTKGRAIRPYEPHVEWHRMKVVVLTSTVTAWEKVVWVNHAMVLEKIKKYKDIHKQVTWTNAQF